MAANRQPHKEDFDVICGDTYHYASVYCEQDEDGELYAVDLSKCRIRGMARIQHNVKEDKFDIPIYIEDQTKFTGVFGWHWPSSFTEQYRSDNRPHKFIYDIQVEDAEGNVYTFQYGTITFLPDVTYLD